MSSRRVAIPSGTESALDRFARQMLIRSLTREIDQMASPDLFGEKSNFDHVRENVLIDSQFIDALPKSALSKEQIAQIQGRTAKSLTLSVRGSKIEMTMEF